MVPTELPKSRLLGIEVLASRAMPPGYCMVLSGNEAVVLQPDGRVVHLSPLGLRFVYGHDSRVEATTVMNSNQ